MPRQKKIIKEPSSVPTDENVVVESVLEQPVEPIQKVKPVKEKKVREKKFAPKEESVADLKIVSPQESPSMYSADIGDKILKLIDEKFKAFGWDVSLIDGHCHKQILSEISMENIVGKKPKVIMCNTVKGKGISFMENKIEWHYKYPNMSQYLEALKELNSKL
jgi:deoxyxylulose-5-phosphate synthase